MIRIGIDGSGILVRQKTGIERYAEKLILALDHMHEEWPDIELFVYVYAGNRFADASLLSHYQSITKKINWRSYPFSRGYRLALSAFCRIDRIDLLHMLAPGILRYNSCPTIATIHDLVWAHMTQEEFAIEGIQAKRAFQTINKFCGFIFVSESTRKDFDQQFGNAQASSFVIHSGVQTSRPLLDTDSIKQKYGIQKYILNVAGLQTRKNQVRLFQAYKQLQVKYNIPHKLILVGRDGLGCKAVYQAVMDLNLQQDVRIIGYVPDSDLASLYHAADLVVYPSLSEGFGFPILEAMSYGAVVVTSNTTSLPEVGGDAVIYCDPKDINDMAQAIFRGLTDQPLRQSLMIKGIQRAALFTWEETARKTISAYRKFAA